MKSKLLILSSLCFLLVAAIFVVNSKSKPEQIYKDIGANLDQLIQRQSSDLDAFEEAFGVYSNPFGIQGAGVFTKKVFLNGGLVFWSDDSFTPPYSILKKPDTIYTVWDAWGLKLIQRRQVLADKDLIEIFSVVQIITDPKISNEYLQSSLNMEVFEKHKVDILQDGEWVFEQKGNVLFRCNILPQSTINAEILGLTLFCVLLSLCFALVQSLLQNRLSPGVYLILQLLFLIAFRFLISFYTSHFVEKWALFDSVHFTAGWIAPSIGLLFFNGLLILLVSIIFYRFIISSNQNYLNRGLFFKMSVLIAILFGQLGMAWMMYQSVWTLLENSQFNLDISESIRFDQFGIVAYFYLILIGLAVFFLFDISKRIFKALRFSSYYIYGLLGFFSVAVAFVFPPSISASFLVMAVLFWVVHFTQISHALDRLKYESFLYVVFVFTAIATITSLAIYKHSEKDDLIAKEKFANRLLISNDILGEYYLDAIAGDISNDIYIRTRLLSKVLARQNIREKIQRQFLSSYFKKYDVGVYLFDEEGNSLDSNVELRNLEEWKSLYHLDEHLTNYEGLYFIQDKKGNSRNRYVSIIDISGYGRKVGSIVIELTLKKYIPKSVFPELLLESKYFLGSKREFDYAVYSNGELSYKQGRHEFENALNTDELIDDQLFTQGIEKNSFHYYGLKTEDGRLFVIVSPSYHLQRFFSNLSFMFLLLVFISGLVFLSLQLFSSSKALNLSTKIQVYLGLSFLIPMVIVSAALINTLNSSYREEIDKSFIKKSYNVAEALLEQSEEFFLNNINVDEYTNEVSKAAALVQSDLNIYDIDGRLITTSQPEIFKLGLQSQLLDPHAYYAITHQMSQNIITDKRVGTLDFKASYTALRSYKDGKLLAILSTPYFDSKNHLRRQQVEVFNNLLVIFSFIFVISLVGGNFIVRGLVKPLKKIGAKIRTMSLQDTNEPIYYEAQDEIGSLVNEYNAMLIKLEQSKEALAASQKESAWKEIARQVAHEIKNPLTPMRLKIQQMMRSFDSDSKPYETCQLLVNQVDSLSSIADSFSEFAKMPAPQNEVVELTELIDHTINLYQTSDVRLVKKYAVKRVNVLIDPKIFSRVLTNLLLNAIQASDGKNPNIVVSIIQQNNKILLSISDSGVGIPESKQEKIFTPYFSTKTQGSGIGLAVAKKGIENAGGNIWFESEEGSGTTFYISLPVHEV